MYSGKLTGYNSNVGYNWSTAIKCLKHEHEIAA